MPSAPLAPILRQLRRLAAGPHAGRSDADLLGRFVRAHDEIAFEEVVRRHGPLVWGVCTRLLRDRHAAEDAFQATFMVLARKAGRLSRPEAVGCWLYGVARRVAGRLRHQSPPVSPMPADIAEPVSRSPLDEVSGRELTAILDDELGRLAERLRAPLVLCYLEGRTRDEAATKLGWSLGTFERRLEQGRAVLRAKLERRGVSLPAALLTAGAASTAVPMGLPAATAQAATAFAIGGLACSVPAAVAEAVMSTAFSAKLRATAMLLFGPLLATAAGWGALTMGGAQPAIPQPAVPGRPAAQAKAEPAPIRTDHYGDPLPQRAVARLGSLRFFHGTDVVRVTYAPDGKVVVSTDRDGGNRFWNAVTGAEIVVSEPIRTSIIVSAGDRLMAIDRRPDGTRVWDVTAGKVVHRYTGSTIGLSPDGNTFVVGQIEGFIGNQLRFRVRFGRIGEEPLSEPIDLIGRQPAQFAFTADGSTVAVRCSDHSVSIIDVTACKESASFPLTNSGGHVDMALSPDGAVVAATAGNEIELFDSRSGKKLRSVPGDKAVQAISFSPDGKLLAATYPSPIVRLWDPATGKEVRSIQGQGAQVFRTTFSSDGKTLAMADGDAVTLWDLTTGRPRHSFGHTYMIWAFAFAADGKTLVSGGSYTDRTVRVWETLTGTLKAEWNGHTSGVDGVAFAPDGKLVVTRSQDGSVRLWDVAANREVRKLAGSHGRVFEAALSPDGRTLATSHVRDDVHLWDVASGQELRAFDQLPKNAKRLEFAPDGQSLASVASGSDTVILTDVATGQTLRRFVGPAEPVRCLAFSSDGKLLAIGSEDGSIRLWDVASGDHRGRIAQVPGGKLNDACVVYSIAFAPDGRCLAAAYRDKSVRLWEVASRSVRAKFDGHQGDVLRVAFSPDGTLLASGGCDRTILVWDVVGRLTRPPGPPLELSAQDADKLWTALAGTDAARAFAAIGKLSDDPRRAVPLIADRLRPAANVDATQIQQLIDDLGSERFATRDHAERALAALGDQAAPALRQVLQRTPSAEVRQRVTTILEKLDPSRSGERLREVRVVETLERIGTPEARQVLQRLASGEPTALLTREAKAALEHLSH